MHSGEGPQRWNNRRAKRHLSATSPSGTHSPGGRVVSHKTLAHLAELRPQRGARAIFTKRRRPTMACKSAICLVLGNLNYYGGEFRESVNVKNEKEKYSRLLVDADCGTVLYRFHDSITTPASYWYSVPTGSRWLLDPKRHFVRAFVSYIGSYCTVHQYSLRRILNLKIEVRS
jgi:hypothetical protein